MTDDDALEVADVVRVLKLKSKGQVRTLWKQGHLKRILPWRPPRYTRESVERVLAGEVYDAVNESVRQASPEAPSPGRRNGGQAHRPVAGEAVGGGGALHRRIGPAPTDVVVRRVAR